MTEAPDLRAVEARQSELYENAEFHRTIGPYQGWPGLLRQAADDKALLLAALREIMPERDTLQQTVANWTIGWQQRHERDVEVNKELDRLRAGLHETRAALQDLLHAPQDSRFGGDRYRVRERAAAALANVRNE